MKKGSISGIVLVFTLLLCFVGKATNEIKTDKPTKEKSDLIVVSDVTLISFEKSFESLDLYRFEAVMPVEFIFNEPKPSAYNYKKIGTPSTKYHSDHLFHPLKLC